MAREQPPSRAIDALRDLNFAANRFRVAVAAHFGVGVRETEAVAHLDAHGALSAGELGRLLALAPGTVTDLLERLERADLAVRDADPRDHRRTIVRPTPRAADLVVQVRGWLAGCLDDVGDLDAAVATMEQVGEHLRRTGDDLQTGPRPRS